MITLKTRIFTILVPGTVACIIPRLMLGQTESSDALAPSLWLLGLLPLPAGIALDL